MEESQEGREAAGEPGMKGVTLAPGQQRETERKNREMTSEMRGSLR